MFVLMLKYGPDPGAGRAAGPAAGPRATAARRPSRGAPAAAARGLLSKIDVCCFVCLCLRCRFRYFILSARKNPIVSCAVYALMFDFGFHGFDYLFYVYIYIYIYIYVYIHIISIYIYIYIYIYLSIYIYI